MRRIYLDNNASTPIAPEVAAVMREAIEGPFGNPSSPHWAGAPARQTVETARRQVADLLGCAPGEVVFTSGGIELSPVLEAMGVPPGGRHGRNPLQPRPRNDRRGDRCSRRGPIQVPREDALTWRYW